MAVNIKDLYGNAGKRFKSINTKLGVKGNRLNRNGSEK